MSKQRFFKGALILTCTGFCSRIIGFFYRIFLSHTIGAQGVGLYQLILPLQNLVMAVTVSGIQTALCRLISSKIALKQASQAKDFFLAGALSSFLFSLAACRIFFCNADFFAAEILKEPLTAPLIRLLSFSFPLSAVHSCINSYYFAEKKTGIPSALQLLEQAVRVGSSYVIFLILLQEKKPVTPILAAGGTVVSEIFASISGLLLLGMLFSREHYVPFRNSRPLSCLREIFRSSFPLTLNRVLLTLLGSIEVILIPRQLQLSGLSSAEALSIYGIFTGMALPLILFPSAVTNSASVMLTPSVAEMQALGYEKRIWHITGKACTGTFLLGSACALFFFLFGPALGNLLFHSPTAGIYIRTMAFICPFLYTNTALTSILHGLGRTGVTLAHNSIGILLRISFVIFAIPVLGIRGYLFGILFSEILLSALHLVSLRHLK